MIYFTRYSNTMKRLLIEYRSAILPHRATATLASFANNDIALLDFISLKLTLFKTHLPNTFKIKPSPSHSYVVQKRIILSSIFLLIKHLAK